jgi:hypothetical protein
MGVDEADVGKFIAGMANTFSLLDESLSEDETLRRELLSAFVRGDGSQVESLLRQVTIAMEYERTHDDPLGVRLSFRIGSIQAALEIAPAAPVAEEE